MNRKTLIVGIASVLGIGLVSALVITNTNLLQGRAPTGGPLSDILTPGSGTEENRQITTGNTLADKTLEELVSSIQTQKANVNSLVGDAQTAILAASDAFRDQNIGDLQTAVAELETAAQGATAAGNSARSVSTQSLITKDKIIDELNADIAQNEGQIDDAKTDRATAKSTIISLSGENLTNKETLMDNIATGYKGDPQSYQRLLNNIDHGSATVEGDSGGDIGDSMDEIILKGVDFDPTIFLYADDICSPGDLNCLGNESAKQSTFGQECLESIESCLGFSSNTELRDYCPDHWTTATCQQKATNLSGAINELTFKLDILIEEMQTHRQRNAVITTANDEIANIKDQKKDTRELYQEGLDELANLEANEVLINNAATAAQAYLTVIEAGVEASQIIVESKGEGANDVIWESEQSVVLGKWNIVAGSNLTIKAGFAVGASLTEGGVGNYFDNLTITTAEGFQFDWTGPLQDLDLRAGANIWVLTGTPKESAKDQFLQNNYDGNEAVIFVGELNAAGVKFSVLDGNIGDVVSYDASNPDVTVGANGGYTLSTAIFTDEDTDQDGITNNDENDLGTDPLHEDTDRDGINDGDELQLGTDPLDEDSDNDGITDGNEIILGSDPLDNDSDDDGLSDGDEIIAGTDLNNPDSDGDGINDGDEVAAGTNPLVDESAAEDRPEEPTIEEPVDEPIDEPVDEPVDEPIDQPVTPSGCVDPFNDTVGHWGENYICQLYENGIVSGKRAGVYAPNDSVTRAEALKIMLSAAGFTTADSAGLTESFPDVNSSDWFLPWIIIAENQGILRSPGEPFHPNEAITRADFTVILIRLAEQTLYGYSQADIPFSDVITSDYFAYAVIIATGTEVDVPDEGVKTVIGGYPDGTFRSGNPISRAETAALILRAQLAWF